MQTFVNAGVDVERVDSAPQFKVGSISTVKYSFSDLASDGTTAQTHEGFTTVRYVKAGAALTAGYCYFIDKDNVAGKQAGSASAVNQTNATGKVIRVGIPIVAIASGSWGWVTISDLCYVRVLAGCVQFVPLYTSATDAVLDDTSSSQTKLNGIHLLSTASAAEQFKVGQIMGELGVG